VINKLWLLATVGSMVVALVTILPLRFGLGLLAILIWFAVPGVLLARRLYGRQPGSWAAALFAGPAWGYVLSSLVLLGLWVAGIRGFGWLMLAPIPAALLVWPAKRLAGTLTVPPIARREIAAWALVTVAVLAIIGPSFAQLGRDLPEGRVYRAYFTADFVWAMAIVSEVSKGDIPPHNPFYANDSLHYYWLMHLLPAVEHHAAPGAFSIDQLLLVNALWTAITFGGFFYFFVRHFVDRPWPAALACVGVLFCSSYEGLDRLWWIWKTNAPMDYLRTLNIDAVGNWIHQGMKIDGVHRLLLYQPQHQIGYILGFSALLLFVQARDCSRWPLALLAGAFLGMSMLLSSFAAAIFAVIVAIYAAIRLIQLRTWKAFVPSAIAAALPIAAALWLSAALQYVDPVDGGRPPLTIGLNPLAANRVMLTIFLNFGPVLMVAAAGLAAGMRAGMLPRFVPLLVALAVNALFYFMVDVVDVQNVYVGFNVGKLVFVTLAPLCGVALQSVWNTTGWKRWAPAAGMAVVALTALPTVLIDLYNTQDVSNRAMGPGFRWTVVLSPDELQGLNWIKKMTPKDARVQVEPEVRGRDTWAYVPAFAERRMYGGISLGMVPLAKYEEVSARIRKEIYQSTSAHDAYERSRAFCIDYLVIGEPERAKYAKLQSMLDQSPHLFAPAFRNSALTVYAVSHDGNRPGCDG
jgi:hypothetical protein